MENLVWDYIKEQELIEEGQNIGVAVSGGPDSMALLVCLCSLGDRHGFNVFCVHFEHGIRGERSLRDAEFVADYCERLSVPMYMSAADVPALSAEWKLSEETAAKRARENYFRSLIESGELDSVATAHHLDDNAESVLMHILRGSGLRGLIGIHSRQEGIIRPFLCVGSELIYDYIRLKDIRYVIDETNADNRYTRNYVRNVLMPGVRENVNRGVTAAVNRLSRLAQTDVEHLEARALEEFAGCAVIEGDTVVIDIKALASMHDAMAGRIVIMAAKRLHIKQDVEMVHVASVLKLAREGKTGGRVNISNNLYALVEYGKLIIGFSGRETDHSFEMRFDIEDRNAIPGGGYVECAFVEECDKDNKDGASECFDSDKLPKVIALRTRHNGDIVRPLNAPGVKKLKDFFIDKKLPREQRNRTPLLADGKNIIWVVGHVISDDYKVDENTRKIIKMKYSVD